MNQLIVMLDKQILRRFPVKATSVTFGRSSKSDIALPDRTISNHHARITVVREDCFLEDLESTNGTYVNQLLVDRHLLEDGDVIGLGKYQVVFRTELGLESQLKRLSLHPKLMDSTHTVWLQVLDGRKAGYIIPLLQERVVLGNLTTGQLLIEPDSQGQYIMRHVGMNAHANRTLAPGDEIRVEDVTFQFCRKAPNADSESHPPEQPADT